MKSAAAANNRFWGILPALAAILAGGAALPAPEAFAAPACGPYLFHLNSPGAKKPAAKKPSPLPNPPNWELSDHSPKDQQSARYRDLLFFISDGHVFFKDFKTDSLSYLGKLPGGARAIALYGNTLSLAALTGGGTVYSMSFKMSALEFEDGWREAGKVKWEPVAEGIAQIGVSVFADGRPVLTMRSAASRLEEGG